ncbi:MAG TPA: ETC complex I subunit [Caulobacteraceae bacterium]|jgi:hypothetical protein
MLARIYKPVKTTMQSGKAKSQTWTLEFDRKTAAVPEHLMGWPSSDDAQSQVVLHFDSSEDAVAYCETHGIPFQLIPDKPQRRIIKAYADNFAFQRREPWTH